MNNYAQLALGFAALLFASCGSNQLMDPNTFYERDLAFQVNGTTYAGIGVIPRSHSYKISIYPPKHTELILLRTCHRDYSASKVSNEIHEYIYDYSPQAGEEDVGVCPLRIESYDHSHGRHAWAYLDFESPALTVPGLLYCNGEQRAINGLGICQGSVGTLQRLTFKERVRFAPSEPSTCNAPVPLNPGPVSTSWEISLSKEECVYHFDTRDGRMGRVVFIGFDGIPIP